MITKGQNITIRPEWRDVGDEQIQFIAIEDEDGGRVKIMALIGLSINPIQVVTTEMILPCAS